MFVSQQFQRDHTQAAAAVVAAAVAVAAADVVAVDVVTLTKHLSLVITTFA